MTSFVLLLALAMTPHDVTLTLNSPQIVDGVRCTFASLVIEDLALVGGQSGGSLAVVSVKMVASQGNEKTLTFTGPSSAQFAGLSFTLVTTGDEYKKSAFAVFHVGPASELDTFSALSRAQRIERAKALAEATLGHLDWGDVPSVHVFTSAKAQRIEFRPIIGAQSVVVLVTAAGVEVSPRQWVALSKPMRRIAALFTANDSVTVVKAPANSGDAFEVQVSHGARGGTEAYRIDPKTFVKTMLWHEAPAARAAPGLPGDDFVEEVD